MLRNMDLNDFLKNFSLDGETIAAVFNEETAPYFADVLGFDERIVGAIFKILPIFLSGELDVNRLIPALLPVFLGYLSNKKDGVQETAARGDVASGGEKEFKKDDEKNYVLDDFIKEENSKEFSPISFYLQNSSAS